MSKQYRSPLMASVHETAEGLHLSRVLDKRTMREFDGLCLTPVNPLLAIPQLPVRKIFPPPET
jgi:putative transcriptional regulator